MTLINTVICIHGIWSHGVSMLLIKRRLEKEYGFKVLVFNYPSVRGTLDDNAKKLSDFIAREGLDAAHMIGHSLGGVIALRMVANDAGAVPGRIVCIGSPLTGSRAANFLSTQNWAEPFMGQSGQRMGFACLCDARGRRDRGNIAIWSRAARNDI
jgi:pimeloyl-ACP methyl ester carboxylesterase